MRTTQRLALVFAGVIVLAGGCSSPKSSAPAADTAAISATTDSLNAAFLAAITAKDTTALANFYAEDTRVMPPNAPVASGRDAARHTWAEFLGSPGLEFTFASTQKMIAQAGDLVVDIGTYDFKAAPPKGKPIHDVGKYVTIFKKTNGEWKIVVDMFSSDLPPQAMKS